MEGRNVIIAIALSLSVILFWEAFMTVPKKELQNNSTSQSKQFKEENDNNKDDSIAPSINEIKIPKSVSRNESIDSVQRIKINNENTIPIYLRVNLIIVSPTNSDIDQA